MDDSPVRPPVESEHAPPPDYPRNIPSLEMLLVLRRLREYGLAPTGEQYARVVAELEMILASLRANDELPEVQPAPPPPPPRDPTG